MDTTDTTGSNSSRRARIARDARSYMLLGLQGMAEAAGTDANTRDELTEAFGLRLRLIGALLGRGLGPLLTASRQRELSKVGLTLEDAIGAARLWDDLAAQTEREDPYARYDRSWQRGGR